ncbi:DUF5316 domain-containing protein [Pseudalkalibacillus salsuginis]|uniref:DUF5316 domain-containing protein n=1 Tax=Pseudalkalibacillus salsuginis TaxID=2910972 RepID=UPI001F30CDAB|nr:DUF5316 domain-containing protein [Pseudalkalibacillus salsuginis]MCF6408471.1 DUF5316 domain-containing protein [Pseudalkalibacillus salsuginis]
MNKSLCAGLMLLVIAIITSIVVDDPALVYKICGTVGLISVLLGGILLGAFISGTQLRANYNTETRDQRHNRNKCAYCILVFGIPNLAAAIIQITWVIS